MVIGGGLVTNVLWGPLKGGEGGHVDRMIYGCMRIMDVFLRLTHLPLSMAYFSFPDDFQENASSGRQRVQTKNRVTGVNIPDTNVACRVTCIPKPWLFGFFGVLQCLL